MVSRKRRRYSFRDWLSKFSGEDFQLIHDAKTDVKVKSKFAFIGSFVLLIFIVSFYSSTHFIYELFNKNLVLAIPIGIFWGLMIIIIYLLLLYTITPKILIGKDRIIRGVKVENQKDNKQYVNLSVVSRVGFVVLIAIIIAQPWLITTFSPYAQEYLDKYKQQYRNDFIIQADSILISQELKLYEDTKKEFNLVSKGSTDSISIQQAGEAMFNKIQADVLFLSQTASLKKEILKLKNIGAVSNRSKINFLNTEITELVKNEIITDSVFILENKPIISDNQVISKILNSSNFALITILQVKNDQYKKLDAVLNASNFYVRKIQIINSEFALSWFMTIFVVLVFIIPIVLKYRIRNTSNFYEVKKDMEEAIVKSDYSKFKTTFTNIFKSKFNLDIQFYESCIDPPFNTIKKKDVKNYKNQSLLLNEIYEDLESSETNKYFVSETIS